jgi:hypothetical protein
MQLCFLVYLMSFWNIDVYREAILVVDCSLYFVGSSDFEKQKWSIRCCGFNGILKRELYWFYRFYIIELS